MKLHITELLAQNLDKQLDSLSSSQNDSGKQFDKDRLKSLKEQLGDCSLTLPDDMIQYAVRSSVERDFLNEDNSAAIFEPKRPEEQGWLRISRLPISPHNDKEYALYPRWQNTIATMHSLNHRICYVLHRKDSETKLYLGAIPTEKRVDGKSAGEHFNQAINSQMPGIGTETTDTNPMMDLNGLRCCGCVTGIPSVRKITQYGEYQTMDQIAMGLRNGAQEQEFAVVVVAEPVPDGKIVDSLRAMQNLGSEIHALTQYSKTDGVNKGVTLSISDTDGTNTGINRGLSVGTGESLGKLLTGSISTGVSMGKFSTETTSQGTNIGESESVSQQYINKSAMYCEEIIDKHIARIKAGRSMGFWKTGVYVLADSRENVKTVMGMLRAVYSGDDTYIEPIRTIMLPTDSQADSVVRCCRHLPLHNLSIAETLGNIYEDYATPMTTEELSIATSLPRRDVPGLRLVRNASRFATNPPPIREKKDGGCPAKIGEVLDTGAKTNQDYRLDLNQLVRHALVAGTNGSGKTYTCKLLLNKVQEEGIPFLVIEPAKDEYLDWAMEWNRQNPDKKQILVFAPGAYMGKEIGQLALNPFQPAVAENDMVNMLKHLDRFKSALLSSLPMHDVLPLIMEETIFQHVNDWLDVKDVSLVGSGSPLDGPYMDDGSLRYPLIESMGNTAREIIEGRCYDKEVEKNIGAAIRTRINALLLGWKKGLFNVPRSTDFSDLFEKNSVVINLSHLADDRDKALVMSILLIALWEYRESKYNTDKKYKEAAKENKLMHLTLIEEAHRLMPNVPEAADGNPNPQGTTAKMFSNMLSEIRAYGEGIVVVDQVPTRLIPDAVKNTNLKIVHRLTSLDDIRAVSTGMMLRPDQESVVGALQQGEAIICSDFDDAAAWVKIKKYN